MKSVTLLLPATDETYSLEQTVRQAAVLLRGREVQYLVITSPKMTTPECRNSIEKLRTEFGGDFEAFDQTRPGIGGALQDAIEKARGEITVIMASDLETDPALLPTLVQKIDDFDIVATSRWKGGARFSGYDPLKLIMNWCFQLFFRLLYLSSLTDLTYAYRAYKTEILKKIKWEENKFPFLFESIVKPLRLGYHATEIEAPWRARTEGISHNSFGQTIDYVRVGLRVRFLAKRSLLRQK